MDKSCFERAVVPVTTSLPPLACLPYCCLKTTKRRSKFKIKAYPTPAPPAPHPNAPFALACERISIKMQSAESRFLTGLENVLSAGTYACTFQSRTCTGWSSEGLKIQRQQQQQHHHHHHHPKDNLLPSHKKIKKRSLKIKSRFSHEEWSPKSAMGNFPKRYKSYNIQNQTRENPFPTGWSPTWGSSRRLHSGRR